MPSVFLIFNFLIFIVMKKLDLDACGVQAMSTEEMKKLDGGCISAFAIVFCALWIGNAIYEALS
jgi:hypothetical protein